MGADPAAPRSPARQARGKVVVGSGWWSEGKPHRWMLGSLDTRAVDFFALWHRQVLRCLQPDRIVVTDSASPNKPDRAAFPDVQWIELDRNYGHPNDIRVGLLQTKWCGFTRTVLSGAMHALCCDADWYVYVEQDCLLHGDDFLEHAIGASTAGILLGAPTENGKGLNGAIAAPMLQQSVIVVRGDALPRFIDGIAGAPWTDGETSPEETMRLRLPPFDTLAVPYGRSRPIDYGRSHFYAQHLEDHELARMRELVDAP